MVHVFEQSIVVESGSGVFDPVTISFVTRPAPSLSNSSSLDHNGGPFLSVSQWSPLDSLILHNAAMEVMVESYGQDRQRRVPLMYRSWSNYTEASAAPRTKSLHLLSFIMESIVHKQLIARLTKMLDSTCQSVQQRTGAKSGAASTSKSSNSAIWYRYTPNRTSQSGTFHVFTPDRLLAEIATYGHRIHVTTAGALIEHSGADSDGSEMNPLAARLPAFTPSKQWNCSTSAHVLEALRDGLLCAGIIL